MSHLGVGNKFRTKNVVPAIEKILSGTALDEPKEEPKTEKVDGRTKEYKNAVKRLNDGGRRKDGPDGRSKSYKETVSRIAARASKSEIQVEESKQEINELFSDVDFLIDQLSNSMEYYSEDDFVEFMGAEIKMSPKIAKQMFRDYWELSAMDRMMYGIDDWKVFLAKYGIR